MKFISSFVVLSIFLIVSSSIYLSEAAASTATVVQQAIAVSSTGNRTLWTTNLYPGRSCAIIFVHGIFASSRYFINQFQEWNSKCSTILFDMYGHGLSTGILAKTNANVFVDDVGAVIKYSKAKTVVLAGWNYGAVAIQQYVRATSDTKVIAMALISGFISAPNPYRDNGDQILIHALGLPAFTQGSLISVAKSLFYPFPTTQLFMGGWQIAAGAALITNYKAVNQLVLTNHSFVQNTFKKPVLVIYGTQDYIINPTGYAQLAKAYSNSTTVSINGSSHACFFTTPTEFNTDFQKWLNKLSI